MFRTLLACLGILFDVWEKQKKQRKTFETSNNFPKKNENLESFSLTFSTCVWFYLRYDIIISTGKMLMVFKIHSTLKIEQFHLLTARILSKNFNIFETQVWEFRKNEPWILKVESLFTGTNFNCMLKLA